jgi:ABC-type phosphate transport system auxiliary subunit
MEHFDKVLLIFIVIGIPALLLLGKPLLRQMLRYRERRFEAEARLASEKAARYAASNERLENRVRVLERIVTDRGLEVSDEIDRLRDAPPN